MAEAKKYTLEELIPLKREKLDPRAKDITGQKFNRLTALFPIIGTGKGVFWACECECGNYIVTRGDGLRKGTTKSCGCWNTEVRSQQFKKLNLEKISWVIGQKFGKLTAIEFNGMHPTTQDRLVHCKCDCGNECDVIVSHLTSGHTQSCGCFRREQVHKALAKDITGMRFGKLVALKPTERRNRNNIYWDCVCDCGNHKDVIVANLLIGHTKSCGCLLSKGEEVIGNLLEDADIYYKSQKTFESCRFDDTGALARFDFYIDEKYLIEFDGIQHFEYKNSGWDTEEHFEKTQEHDTYKNQWCKDNNIPLIRIPYTKLDTLCIEDLILETTQFRIV